MLWHTVLSSVKLSCALVGMDIVFRPLKDAVNIDIPHFHTIGAGRARVEEINNLFSPPRPEYLGINVTGDGQIDFYLRLSAWMGERGAILPRLGIIPNGII